MPLLPLEWRARATSRAYWRLRYRDGRIITEPECDWSLAPRRGWHELQLVCPDGKVGTLGLARGDATGRFFQFKSAFAAPGIGRRTTAQVIGLVTGTDGEALCYVWDYTARCLVGPFADNVAPGRWHYGGFAYQFAWDHLGAQPA